MTMIDDNLVDLDFSALYRMADWHEKQADVLRSRAHRLEQYEVMENNIDREIKFLQGLPRTVAKYLRQGHCLSKAIALTCSSTGVKSETVQKYWLDFVSVKNEKNMVKRNELIFDLANLGLKNEQIGERLGLHKNSVSRIISQEKRRRFCQNSRPERVSAALGTFTAPKPQSEPVAFPALAIVL